MSELMGVFALSDEQMEGLGRADEAVDASLGFCNTLIEAGRPLAEAEMKELHRLMSAVVAWVDPIREAMQRWRGVMLAAFGLPGKGNGPWVWSPPAAEATAVLTGPPRPMRSLSLPLRKQVERVNGAAFWRFPTTPDDAIAELNAYVDQLTRRYLAAA